MINMTILNVLYGSAIALAALSTMTVLVTVFIRSLNPELKANWAVKFNSCRVAIVKMFEQVRSKIEDMTNKKEVDG